MAEHRVPIIETMLGLLRHLERSAGGMTVNELARAAGAPRSSVYRVLNTLEADGIVRRLADGGRYVLGPRLIGLAARVPSVPGWADLAAGAGPHLRRLTAELGLSSKLSVLDGDEVLCVAAVQSEEHMSIAVAVGQRFPLHAGAASKVLFAHLDEARRARLLARPLPAYTPRTVTDPERLQAEFARIRRQGWAEDRGEFALSGRAQAAPVRDGSGIVVAAVSAPFLADDQGSSEVARIREAVVTTAAAVTALNPARERRVG